MNNNSIIDDLRTAMSCVKEIIDKCDRGMEYAREGTKDVESEQERRECIEVYNQFRQHKRRLTGVMQDLKYELQTFDGIRNIVG